MFNSQENMSFETTQTALEMEDMMAVVDLTEEPQHLLSTAAVLPQTAVDSWVLKAIQDKQHRHLTALLDLGMKDVIEIKRNFQKEADKRKRKEAVLEFQAELIENLLETIRQKTAGKNPEPKPTGFDLVVLAQIEKTLKEYGEAYKETYLKNRGGYWEGHQEITMKTQAEREQFFDRLSATWEDLVNKRCETFKNLATFSAIRTALLQWQSDVNVRLQFVHDEMERALEKHMKDTSRFSSTEHDKKQAIRTLVSQSNADGVAIRQLFNDEHAYGDDEIDLLMHHYLDKQNISDYLSSGLSADCLKKDVIKEALICYQAERDQALAQKKSRKKRVLMPICLGMTDDQEPKWGLLVIRYADERFKYPIVFYFDPLNQAMPEKIKTMVNELFPGNKMKVISAQSDQTIGHTGAWIIYAAQHLFNKHTLPALSDIVPERQAQQQIIADGLLESEGQKEMKFLKRNNRVLNVKIFEQNVSPNLCDVETHNTLLHTAVLQADLNGVKLLLGRDANPLIRNKAQKSALRIAAEQYSKGINQREIFFLIMHNLRDKKVDALLLMTREKTKDDDFFDDFAQWILIFKDILDAYMMEFKSRQDASWFIKTVKCFSSREAPRSIETATYYETLQMAIETLNLDMLIRQITLLSTRAEYGLLGPNWSVLHGRMLAAVKRFNEKYPDPVSLERRRHTYALRTTPRTSTHPDQQVRIAEAKTVFERTQRVAAEIKANQLTTLVKEKDATITALRVDFASVVQEIDQLRQTLGERLARLEAANTAQSATSTTSTTIASSASAGMFRG